MFDVQWSRQGKKGYDVAVRAGHRARLAEILSVLRRDPYEDTPGHCFEALSSNLKGAYSRRVNYRNRVVYTIHPNTENLIDPQNQEPFEGIALVHSAWGHGYPEIDRKYRNSGM